ncbi:periphilin-1 isoform X1 [Amia ocellicauda]|uniref:periphilin-1 isoform X1 n=1 Tax=Amia ocellicauda TaxID=2972642 RepID=UPI003464B640
MAYRRERGEMRNDVRYEYERAQRERFAQGRGGPYQRVVNVVPRKPFFERPGEGYNREFEYEDPRNYHGEDLRNYPEENFGNERRNGPPNRREDVGYRWPREEHHRGRLVEFRKSCDRMGPRPSFRNQRYFHAPMHPPEVFPGGCYWEPQQGIQDVNLGEDRDSYRRKGSFPPQHVRERSPIKKELAPFKNSPGGRRESPHSRSGSSLSSRSYSPDKNKSHSFQTQQKKNKEKPSSHSLNTSRDASPQSSTSTSKISLDKSSKPPEPQPAEALSERPDETLEKSNDVSETRPEFEDIQNLQGEQEEPQMSKDESAKLLSEDFQERRSQAIAAKAREIEQVYRQDCETFGMVVKMLVAKEPSLEKQLQSPLKENLTEIRERCLEDLKHFISDLDQVVLQPQ